MKVEFAKKELVCVSEIPYGNLFKYRDELYLKTKASWEECNKRRYGANLKSGELIVFGVDDKVEPVTQSNTLFVE